MKVSLRTIKSLTSVDISVDDLLAKVNSQLGGVEGTTDLSARYDGATIVKVESCEKHPNADKLNICQIDDGGSERIQVVCGAPNVRSGMYAVWLRPGSVVPSTADDAEPFVLGARELRGAMSNGMLASPKELGLGDSHEGILELSEDDKTSNGSTIRSGASFAETFGLEDTTIDIENKMFTHRPDLFGQLGVAREIAGIQHIPFKSPEWYTNPEPIASADASEPLELNVFNDVPDLSPRFMSVVMNGVQVKPSPIWLQAELVRLGGKPISNIVDATNYVMLMTAQPTHAYDYSKLRGATLGVRMAAEGEKATLLNGKTYELTSGDIVIADGSGPVGLAGIMGGADSEVSSETKDIVIEVANFDMYTVRKSSMRHGVFTDALTRFNKGQSPLQNDRVLGFLVNLIREVAGGEVVGQVYDRVKEGLLEASDDQANPLIVAESFINERLGLQLSSDEMAGLLRNVECDVEVAHGALTIRPPFWRTDLQLGEDIVEEVGRLYGFDKLPRELPMRTARPTTTNGNVERKRAIRNIFSNSGANEVLTYSFVHEKLMNRSGQDTSHAFKLANALSPDLQYYRMSLMPSLIDKVHMNMRAGHDNFALFELGTTHFKGEMDEAEPTIPNEDEHTALVIAYADKAAPDGAAYYQAKRYLELIVDTSSNRLTKLSEFDVSSDAWGQQLTAMYEPGRSAVIVKDNEIWGVVGEFRADVRKAFKLPGYAAGFEVHNDIVDTIVSDYRPLSRFPNVTQDISLQVDSSVEYSALESAARSALADLDDSYLTSLTAVNIYRPKDSPTKTISFRLVVSNYERTLTDADVRVIVYAIAARCEQSNRTTMV